MVLETLFSAKSIHRHPLLMIIHALVLSSVGIWVAFYSFPQWANMLSLAFVAIGFIPVMENLLKHEEKIEAKRPGFAGTFVARHFNIVQAYAWIFIGLIISYAFWYSVMPADTRASVFGEQEQTFKSIGDLKQNLTGKFSGATATCNQDTMCWFQVIFANNASLTVLFIFLGLVFGAGAIFLLAWNASVIGVVIGQNIVALTASYQQFGFLNGIFAFFHGLFNSLGLLPHGIFEASGYFFASIAGAIIGIALTRRHYYKHEINTILKDSILLTALSLACIAIGAIIEAFIIVSSI